MARGCQKTCAMFVLEQRAHLDAPLLAFQYLFKPSTLPLFPPSFYILGEQNATCAATASIDRIYIASCFWCTHRVERADSKPISIGFPFSLYILLLSLLCCTIRGLFILLLPLQLDYICSIVRGYSIHTYLSLSFSIVCVSTHIALCCWAAIMLVAVPFIERRSVRYYKRETGLD